MNKIILAIVATALVGGGAYFVMNKDDKEESQSTSSNSSPASSSSSSASNATSKFDNPCEVVSKADVEAAFGKTFKEGKDESNANNPVKNCLYEEQNDGSVSSMTSAINFTVTLDTQFKDEASATQEMKTIRSTAKLGDKTFFVETPAPGVGDDAFFFQGQGEIVLKTEEFMYARKGSQIFHFVAVRLDGVDHSKAKLAITDLAKKALN